MSVMETNERKQSLRVTGVARACLVVAVGACCGTVSEAFVPRPWTITNSLTPSPSTKPGPRKVPTKSGAAMMAAKGFGNSPEPSPRASSSKGFEETPVADSGSGGVADWEKEYKAYIKRTGQYLCSMSWEGHEEMGRGAIFANYDDARAGGKLNEADKLGGIPSMYVPLTEFESMKMAEKAGEENDLDQILKRVKSYRPQEEFVVVFQAEGVMGADVVRPNVSPPEMAKHVTRSDGASRSTFSQAPWGEDDGGGIIDV
ncbi:unnamed protein product [Ascophyllum nodosum]